MMDLDWAARNAAVKIYEEFGRLFITDTENSSLLIEDCWEEFLSKVVKYARETCFPSHLRLPVPFVHRCPEVSDHGVDIQGTNSLNPSILDLNPYGVWSATSLDPAGCTSVRSSIEPVDAFSPIFGSELRTCSPSPALDATRSPCSPNSSARRSQDLYDRESISRRTALSPVQILSERDNSETSSWSASQDHHPTAAGKSGPKTHGRELHRLRQKRKDAQSIQAPRRQQHSRQCHLERAIRDDIRHDQYSASRDKTRKFPNDEASCLPNDDNLHQRKIKFVEDIGNGECLLALGEILQRGIDLATPPVADAAALSIAETFQRIDTRDGITLFHVLQQWFDILALYNDLREEVLQQPSKQFHLKTPDSLRSAGKNPPGNPHYRDESLITARLMRDIATDLDPTSVEYDRRKRKANHIRMCGSRLHLFTDRFGIGALCIALVATTTERDVNDWKRHILFLISEQVFSGLLNTLEAVHGGFLRQLNFKLLDVVNFARNPLKWQGPLPLQCLEESDVRPLQASRELLNLP